MRSGTSPLPLAKSLDPRLSVRCNRQLTQADPVLHRRLIKLACHDSAALFVCDTLSSLAQSPIRQHAERPNTACESLGFSRGGDAGESDEYRTDLPKMRISPVIVGQLKS